MTATNRRLLIVDDNTAIHDDFRKILGVERSDAELASMEVTLFETASAAPQSFELTAVSQGEQAFAVVRDAMAADRPFAAAFVDIRMPPGIDGIETARQLWTLDPDLAVVICTAYSDYTWPEMTRRLGAPDRWLLLKKPFDNIEVRQLAAALVERRSLQRLARIRETELETMVGERTAKLAAAVVQLQESTDARLRAEAERRDLERKLEHAQRLESLGVLAGGVAHDFNNLLAAILGRASLAQVGATPDEIAVHLREITLCGRRAAELCEQMLAFAGHSRVVGRELDVDGLVRETERLFRASLPPEVDFTIELSGASPLVCGDPMRLRQLVMNLVANGAEALGPAPRRLSLGTALQSLSAEQIGAFTYPGDASPGDYVMVRVADTGCGMSPETMRRIFDPFYTTKFEGRGLGLSAALGIVRGHGGALDVASEPGHGSTFRVFLPLIGRQTASSPPEPAPAASPLPAERSRRILVVDDEECVRTVVVHALKRPGYTFETACDGAEALDKFRAAPASYDGIVIDYSMPRMDGAAALRAMRALRPDLPAILVSGFNQSRFDDQSAVGAETIVLQKPFEVEELRRSLDTVLRAKPPA